MLVAMPTTEEETTCSVIAVGLVPAQYGKLSTSVQTVSEKIPFLKLFLTYEY